MTGLSTDLRNALRSLMARPTFTIVLVVTLGLGIGATTTVYSFVYALLLRPYPYAAPDGLVRVQSVYTKEGGAKRGMSLLDIQDYRRLSSFVAGIGAYTVFDTRLLTDGAPVVVSTSQLDADALRLLGVAPALGRLFTADEDRPGGDVNEAVIAYELWQSQFGSDPAILGKPLRTDRLTYTIIGVMPPGFAFRIVSPRGCRWSRGTRTFPPVMIDATNGVALEATRQSPDLRRAARSRPPAPT
jgi:putative ABC transport system permease protein